MNILTDKAKHYLVLLLKLLIVSGAFYYIYNQLSKDKTLDFQQLMIVLKKPDNYFLIFLLLLLTFSNRFIEILKWRNLASLVRPLTVGQATKQVLSALTLGIFTPNGIGEYAGKALYFDKKDTPRIIFLNMVCNGVQIIYAILFGLFGLTVLNQIHPILPNNYLFVAYGTIVIVGFILFSARHFTIKGYSLNTVIQLLNQIPAKKHRINLTLALGRYLSFTHQYVILYYLFEVDIPYFQLFCAISAIYLLASSLPNFQFLEFAVKGSIALFIFSNYDINQWIIALVATLIWLLNIVLPISIGSYFVLTFKFKKTPIK